jgi:hypothetical protein
MMLFRARVAPEKESLSEMCAQRFYPQAAAKLAPLPLFLDLFIPKDFKCNEFGSVHSERLTSDFFAPTGRSSSTVSRNAGPHAI